MTHIYRGHRARRSGDTLAWSILLGVAVMGLAGCKLDVANPRLIDAAKFDPSTDGVTLAYSAQTLFWQNEQRVDRSRALLSEALWSGAVRAQSNDFSRRTFDVNNVDITIEVLDPISRAFIANDDVVQTLSGGANAASDVNLALASMNAAFALESEAEIMCQTVIRSGPAFSPAQVADSVIVRFQKAIQVASAATGNTQAAKIVNASTVGLARAYLQKGDFANASATAQLVMSLPESQVEYDMTLVDDPGNRNLGNTLFGLTTAKGAFVVPPMYRINDSRVQWVNTKTVAQDQVTPLVSQRKYTSYAGPIRIASALEAQYIYAEAELRGGNANPAPAIALIAARTGTAFANPSTADSARAAGADPTPLSSGSTLNQLMQLRAREFWLEGKKLGDIRRNPSDAAYYDPPGTTFYKAGAPFGDQVCLPVPVEETIPNPNA